MTVHSKHNIQSACCEELRISTVSESICSRHELLGRIISQETTIEIRVFLPPRSAILHCYGVGDITDWHIRYVWSLQQEFSMNFCIKVYNKCMAEGFVAKRLRFRSMFYKYCCFHNPMGKNIERELRIWYLSFMILKRIVNSSSI
jgi:hypothetical protein